MVLGDGLRISQDRILKIALISDGHHRDRENVADIKQYGDRLSRWN